MDRQIEVFTTKEKALEAHTGGSSLQCYMKTTYQKLVALFGMPLLFDNYKSDAEWVVRFKGEILTIYNYKTGKNYLGEDGQETEDITDWHIGGTNKEIAEEFSRMVTRFEVYILKAVVVKI